MEKKYIEYLLGAGYAVISEHNNKMIRDVGEGIEVYDSATDSFPAIVFATFKKAFEYFEQ